MRLPPRLAGLTSHVLLPVLGTFLLWVLAALTVGTADAVRLLAALTTVRAVQLLTRLPTISALRRRGRASFTVVRESRHLAIKIQSASMVAGLSVLAGLLVFLLAARQIHLATLTALIAIGYPVRNLLQMQAHCNVRLFLRSLPWIGATLTGLALLLDLAALEIAYLLGMREWIAALLSLMWKERDPSSAAIVLEPITAAEVAAVTALRARRAFAYLVGKALLGVVIPGAGVLARTGRRFKIHHRLERFVPQNRRSFILFSLGPASAAVAIILWLPEPSLLLVAALLMRVAAAAGSVLIWSPYLTDGGEEPADYEEDQ